MDTKELYQAHDTEIKEALANLPTLEPVDGECEMCSAPTSYTILNDQKLCRGCYYAVTQFEYKKTYCTKCGKLCPFDHDVPQDSGELICDTCVGVSPEDPNWDW